MASETATFFGDARKRFFFLYGNTDDEFCLGDLAFLGIEQLLARHLRAVGYRRIVYCNGSDKVYTRDAVSASLLHPSRPATSPSPRPAARGKGIPGGPLGGEARILPTSRSPEGNSPLDVKDHIPEGEVRRGFPHMNDLEVVQTLHSFMRDRNTRTAVIFADGLDLIHHFDVDARRQMSLRLSQWNSGTEFGHRNQNIAIFVFPGLPAAHLMELLRQPSEWALLHSLMFQERRPSDRMLAIGAPHADEIANALDSHRLQRGLRVENWEHWLHVVPRIAAHRRFRGASLKVFPTELQKLPTEGNELMDSLSQLSGEENGMRPMERLQAMHGLDKVSEMLQGWLDEAESVGIGRGNKHGGRDATCVGRLLPAPRRARLNLHLVLKGNPGTGKSTVAMLLGQILRDEGLLESGHIVKASREDLVGGYVGQTALKTAAKIQEAMGGVLLVDEAYRLAQGGEGDFGQEALDTIMEAMEREMGQFSVVLAGYPVEIDHVIKSNPGFARRFGLNVVEIPDYAPATLERIFLDHVAQEGRTIEAVLASKLPHFFEKWYEARNPRTFGNASDVQRVVYQSMEKSRKERVKRAGCVATEPLQFVEEDVAESQRRFLPGHTEFLDRAALQQALAPVRAQDDSIRQLVDTVDVWYAQPLKPQPLSLFLVGASGVGKTYTAECLGNALEQYGYRYCYVPMTEYTEEHSISNLLGSPRGYVGSNETPYLFAELEKSPRLVICFDEIEKAHPVLLKALMQLPDKGTLSWRGGQGDFRECILLFTSNACVQEVTRLKQQLRGAGWEMSDPSCQVQVRDALLQTGVAPEIWGRIKRFLVYDPLPASALLEIVDKVIEQTGREQCGGFEVVSIGDAYRNELVERSAGSLYGIRPLKDTVLFELGKPLLEFRRTHPAATRVRIAGTSRDLRIEAVDTCGESA